MDQKNVLIIQFCLLSACRIGGVATGQEIWLWFW
jgi:hypothetical protein